MDVMGSGAFSFVPQPGWAKLPDEIVLGDVAGIAVDDRDRVYLFNRGEQPVVVLDRDGGFLNAWGQGVFANAHGAHIGADQSIYLTDNGDHTLRKFSLDGALQLTIGQPGKPSPFMSGKPFCRCTHSALSPSGDIYVSDGYGNACVHKYDPAGRHLLSWGSPGTGPGEFNLPHNICCDADGWVYVADRENHRVQIFDGNGRYESQVNNMHRPSALVITPGPCPHCIVGELKSYLAVNLATPNLGARVSVLDTGGKLLSRLDLGMGPGLEPGQFVSPHSIALDSRGDMYVGEVAATDWSSVFPETPRPERLGRFQKFVRQPGVTPFDVFAPRAFDVIVLGAGAAGLMCAGVAGQRGKRVLLLDHADEAGKKILISGGGRCNFTNLGTVPERFLSSNRHFVRSALSRYTQHDFLTLVNRHGIAWHEKTLGQLFCDDSARDIVAMLLGECRVGGVDVRLGHRVTGVTRGDRFRVETDHGAFEADAMVLATGGLSIPKMGATGFAYDLARQFGLRVIEPRPGLVPLTFADDALALMRPLSGVALPVVARAGKTAFAEAMLFTHRGLSGPAILQISSLWQAGAITLDCLPGRDARAELLARKLSRPRAEFRTVLAELVPQRLAAALAPASSPTMANMPDRALAAMAARLQGWTVTPSGTEGYAKAEVTLGGIDTRDLSSQTMQANAVPGLFAIGEAVDVTGWLGGYNFQWAWSSGWCAGMAI